MTYAVKACAVCGGNFHPAGPRTMTCSIACTRQRKIARGRKFREANRERLNARKRVQARDYREANRERINERTRKRRAANRKAKAPITKVCVICSRPFYTRHPLYLTCSVVCSRECRARRRLACSRKCRVRQRLFSHQSNARLKKCEYHMRACVICGGNFRPAAGNVLSCSNACRGQRKAEYMHNWRAVNRKHVRKMWREWAAAANRRETNYQRRLAYEVVKRLGVPLDHLPRYYAQSLAYQIVKKLGVTFDHLPEGEDR